MAHCLTSTCLLCSQVQQLEHIWYTSTSGCRLPLLLWSCRRYCRYHQIRGQLGTPYISTIYQKGKDAYEDTALYTDVWTELPIMPHSWTSYQRGKSLCHTINRNVRHQECVVKPPLSIKCSYFQQSVGLTLDTHTYIFCMRPSTRARGCV